MANYQLSLEAENDIENVLDFGIRQFGIEQALEYHDALKSHFAEMANNPLHYMKVDHISLGSRAYYRTAKLQQMKQDKQNEKTS